MVAAAFIGIFGLVAVAAATVDALLVQPYKNGAWMAYTAGACVIGMLLASLSARLTLGQRIVATVAGAFGLFLIAIGTSFGIALLIVDTPLADSLRKHVTGVVSAPADSVGYQAIFAIPSIAIGLVWFLPVERYLLSLRVEANDNK